MRKPCLAPGAIPALQALYGGTRAIDTVNGTQFSTDSTKPLNIPKMSGNATSISLPGDLPTAQTTDDFAFQAPKLADAPFGVDVKIQTGGISLLTPKVSVFDDSGRRVATASASGPLEGGPRSTWSGWSRAGTTSSGSRGPPATCFPSAPTG